jgi:hypothetical protein
MRIGEIAMDNQRKRVDRRAVHQDVELDQVGLLVASERVVERGIALGAPRLFVTRSMIVPI